MKGGKAMEADLSWSEFVVHFAFDIDEKGICGHARKILQLLYM